MHLGLLQRPIWATLQYEVATLIGGEAKRCWPGPLSPFGQPEGPPAEGRLHARNSRDMSGAHVTAWPKALARVDGVRNEPHQHELQRTTQYNAQKLRNETSAPPTNEVRRPGA